MATVFSFCIYGRECARYHLGLLQNIELVRRHFPTWKVYVYYGADITETYKETLQGYSHVVLRETGELGAINMIHRFFAIDEAGVQTMFVRDADSRIHWRDRWAIRDFLSRSEFIAHSIRDHTHHTAALMGGLWGLRKQSGVHVRTQFELYKTNEVNHGHAYDQDFLIERMYPLVKPHLLVHKCEQAPSRKDECVVVFPFQYSNDVYCGRIEDTFVDNPAPRSNQLLPFLRQVPVKVSGL